jgi:Methyltransferase domain
MSLAYKLLYAVGYTPWEQTAELQVVNERVAALFEREEEGRRPPYGQALDLGCGSGFWAVELARRGWQVTGVDLIPKALRRARERARQAGVELRLVEGDVTNLEATGVGSGFRLLLDFFLFHDELTDEQREAMGREVTARAGATSATPTRASTGFGASELRAWPGSGSRTPGRRPPRLDAVRNTRDRAAATAQRTPARRADDPRAAREAGCRRAGATRHGAPSLWTKRWRAS